VCTRLLPAALIAAWSKALHDKCEWATGLLVVAASFNLRKLIMLCAETGELSLCDLRGALQFPAVPKRAAPSQPQAADESAESQMLKWVEELSSRLDAGTYRCEPIIPLETVARGVSLFPQNGPQHSVAVTNGIRVTASAVFSVEQRSPAMIYSIRIALLLPGEEGYLTRAERGFETAQLHSRHWIITDATGRQEHVRGDGVVGKYPLLKEGGWRDDQQKGPRGVDDVEPGRECDGIFVYQSMSGPSGTFEGELFFVPGSLHEPEGDEFAVTVAPFPLARSGFLF